MKVIQENFENMTSIKKILFISLLLLSTACGNTDNLNINLSQKDVISNLTGKYEGTYKNTIFEIWIEKSEQSTHNQSYLYIFIFEKDKVLHVNQFLTKYQDTQMYSNSICEYVKKNPNKFLNHTLQESPSMFYDVSVEEIWNWNNLGGLGYFFVSIDNLSSVSFDIDIQHYINLPINDEHGLTKLYTNSKGEGVKVKLFETGFFKKLWNYPLGGPSIEIQKISSDTTGLLDQYHKILHETREAFTESGKTNRSYCDLK